MSEFIFFIPVSLIVLFISYSLFRKAAGSLNIYQPNMISYIFYYNILLQTFIASILVILKLDGHYVISRVGDDTRLFGWAAVNYMMLAMPFGMLLARRFFLSKRVVNTCLISYCAQNINVNFIGNNPLKYSIWVFTVISLLSCLYVFFVLGYFPLLKIFDVSALFMSELRGRASRGFDGNVYVRNFLALTMMPILSYMWFFYYLYSKKSLDLFVFSVCFVFSISILYYNFSKAPVLFYILSFIFAFYYANGKVSKRFILISVSIVFTLIVSVYSFMGEGVKELLSYNSGPVGRVLLGQSAGLYIMLDIFPDTYPFIGVASLSELLNNIFGFEYVDRAARTAMIYFNPKGVEAGTSGVMNSIYIAEAWANFGLVGLILSPIWVGFAIQSLYIYFLTSPKSPLHLAFFVSFSTGGSVAGGFNDYLYNPNILLVMFFSLIVFSLAKFFKYLK